MHTGKLSDHLSKPHSLDLKILRKMKDLTVREKKQIRWQCIIISRDNGPFYSWVLSDLALDCKRGCG